MKEALQDNKSHNISELGDMYVSGIAFSKNLMCVSSIKRYKLTGVEKLVNKKNITIKNNQYADSMCVVH